MIKICLFNKIALQSYYFFLTYTRKTAFFVRNGLTKFAYIKYFLYLCTQIQ